MSLKGASVLLYLQQALYSCTYDILQITHSLTLDK